MPQPNRPALFLSKDKRYLTDDKDNIIATRQDNEELTYYRAVGIESEAFEKKCIQITQRKVCIQWNEARECQIWDEVPVCTKWELVSAGYSNIS